MNGRIEHRIKIGPDRTDGLAARIQACQVAETALEHYKQGVIDGIPASKLPSTPPVAGPTLDIETCELVWVLPVDPDSETGAAGATGAASEADP